MPDSHQSSLLNGSELVSESVSELLTSIANMIGLGSDKNMNNFVLHPSLIYLNELSNPGLSKNV